MPLFAKAVPAAAALVAMASIAACGGGGLQQAEESAVTTATSSSSTTPPPPPTVTAPGTTSETPISPSTPSSSDEDSTNQTPPAAGGELTLANFFQPLAYWVEERYDIASQSGVAGISTEITSCSQSSDGWELELRLANNFEKLSFSVGQANESNDSDQAVRVEVVANNQQVDVQSVPFNIIQSFEIPVVGINALKLQFRLDDRVEPCGGSVIAVLIDPILT